MSPRTKLLSRKLSAVHRYTYMNDAVAAGVQSKSSRLAKVWETD